MAPLFTTPSVNFGPYAQCTKLGWGVVGCVGHAYDSNGNHSHCTLSYQVFKPNGYSASHHSAFCFKTCVKQELSPWDMSMSLEQDFKDCDDAEIAFSVEDHRFLKLMRAGISQENGVNYTMPLPFKVCDKPVVPDNKMMAMTRLSKLKNRCLQDPDFFDKYSSCIDMLIESKHAERVPEDEIERSNYVWYLPHHGVVHARKPGKLRVVFDSSARFKGVAFNDLLLKGPDLNNSLIGVLLRFRKDVVAPSCDIKQMFYNFHVADGFRDYLRFMWFDGNNLTKEPITFRMTTHAFGLTSSPSCANFAMRQLAQDFCTPSNKCASDFMQTGFYVDDGLISLSSDEEVIDLIDKTVSLCSKGGLDLHKFSSNSKFVMQYVSERYDSELSTDLPGPTIERLLGVVWCVESDTLQFRIIVDSKPFTRRGILSTVSSIYDPLGFVGPFVLEGKRILQYMCQSSYGWDSPIADEILPWWQQWLASIPKLEIIKLKRRFKSSLSINSFAPGSAI